VVLKNYALFIISLMNHKRLYFLDIDVYVLKCY